MKKFFILIIIFILFGCTTVPKYPSCPSEDTLFMTPIGPMQMPKGFFDTGENQNWMHTDDFKKQKGL
uniref:Lipoprotein n=1 Tax=viral metagenome TaxID=1070528 RepID=A0A6M3IGQ1_9ZZZZ